jgi:cytochrome c-type biogenesis protein CcmH/NrfF
MKTRSLTLILTILAIMLIVTACSSGTTATTSSSSNSSTTQDGATLVKERCTVCHSLSRVESQKHNATDWKTIVDMMIGKGAQLTSEEETVVVNYLATNFGQ